MWSRSRRLLPPQPRYVDAVLAQRHPHDRARAGFAAPGAAGADPAGPVTGSGAGGGAGKQPRLLIMTADDVGMTAGVCRAVARAHRDGIVTSASVLAVGRAFPDAARLARSAPTLGIGAHLAMVGEDPPLLSAREIPTLVDRRGRLPLAYRTVVGRGLSRRIDPADVRREFGAQLERIAGIGVPVTHVDTHQHVHLWPAVAEVVVELARRPQVHVLMGVDV